MNKRKFTIILVLLCLIIGGLIYFNRREAVPVPTPVVGPAPTPVEPTPPEKTNVEVRSTLPSNKLTNSLVVTETVDDANLRPIESSWKTDRYSTNRIALSLRFGLNISGRFRGVGSSFSSGSLLSGGRQTPNGDAYNYDNGYVLTDISGNFGGQTWYWGYDNASQVNSSANTIDFNRTVATGLPSENSGNASTSVGVELTYDRELGVKENWHHLRYGLEGAVNFMPIEFNSGGLYNATVSQQTDTYSYTSGTTPPPAPYQGNFGGPGFTINVPAVNSITTPVPGATFLAQQHFDANLWGLRLGPYAELPISEKLDLFFTGGLAVGLLDGEASWKETLTLPGGGGSLMGSGGGNDTTLLWGYYLGLNASYQWTERWDVEAGLQFQDLGTYNHNFGGREAELDLSKSIFVHAGVSFSF